MSFFPKAPGRSYVFLRQEKELENRDQRKTSLFPSNCFHSNHAANNAKRFQEWPTSFFLKRVCYERVKGRLSYEREILIPC